MSAAIVLVSVFVIGITSIIIVRALTTMLLGIHAPFADSWVGVAAKLAFPTIALSLLLGTIGSLLCLAAFRGEGGILPAAVAALLNAIVTVLCVLATCVPLPWWVYASGSLLVCLSQMVFLLFVRHVAKCIGRADIARIAVGATLLIAASGFLVVCTCFAGFRARGPTVFFTALASILLGFVAMMRYQRTLHDVRHACYLVASDQAEKQTDISGTDKGAD